MRWLVVLVVSAVVAVAAGGTGSAATQGPSSAGRGSPDQAVAAQGVSRVPALEDEVLAAINMYRTQRGLVALKFNAQLAATAREHSMSMATNGYFEHSGVTGAPFWKRVQGKYSKRASRWIIGENLVWASPDLSAQEALEMWLLSAEHRKNLLRPAWREIGLGAVHSLSAPGIYGGLAATILTADFGVRAR